jgi:retron-type reverse transcriptase
MTPGATAETVDAMSLEKIDTVIDALRHERYRWTPVRRMYIPKKLGKRCPLGFPKCELCGATDSCEVHHIRKLADLNKPG